MAKESGLGANAYIDGIDVSNDTLSFDKISKSESPIPVTGIDKLAFERLAGQLDGEIGFTVAYNPTNAHVALKDFPRTDRIVSYLHRATLGVPVASMTAKQINYDGNRGNDGAFPLKVQALANANWLDWGLTLTAGKRTDTTATNGTGVDFLAAGTFGLQAYLHVFAFTGTSFTVTLQSATTLGGAYSNITGGAFTAASAVGSQRIQTARNGTQNQFIRAITTGTFSNAVFAVACTVNRVDNTI